MVESIMIVGVSLLVAWLFIWLGFRSIESKRLMVDLPTSKSPGAFIGFILAMIVAGAVAGILSSYSTQSFREEPGIICPIAAACVYRGCGWLWIVFNSLFVLRKSSAVGLGESAC
ncbi:MAG: hypothetical protein PHQ75_08870 [Thermoguttaceae bacterium]|nr:hypothetical protein [Thermoguttaceae bacterium]